MVWNVNIDIMAKYLYPVEVTNKKNQCRIITIYKRQKRNIDSKHTTVDNYSELFLKVELLLHPIYPKI